MAVAQPTPVNISSEYISTLKSRNTTSINPQVEGQITQIYVKSGERVQRGALLMQIDPLKQQATTGSQEAARKAQEANLEYAGKRASLRLGPVRLELIPTGAWARWDRQRLQRTGGTAEQYKHPCLIADPAFGARALRGEPEAGSLTG